jgi:chemotaxis protein MotB
MNTTRAFVACAVAVASLTLGGCGSDRDLAYKDTQIQELERVNKELEAQLAAKASADVTRVINNAPANTPESVVVTEAAGKGVNVSSRDREVVFSIESSILFKPGSSELTTQAKESISRVVAIINQKYTNHYVRVEGHTDDQPITRTKDKWQDNWDLAGGRARQVLHYLLQRGIPAKDLGFAGYADQRPLADGKNETARKQNRRVEIVAIPKN